MATDLKRRMLLKGGKALTIRPPWAVVEEDFVRLCTGCGECLTACPEHILQWDATRLPRVDFSRGQCTFCGRCLTSCPENALAGEVDESPWNLKAEILPSCLVLQGTACRSCAEYCQVAAIRFRPALGGCHELSIAVELCTGCGACYAVCPVQAVRLTPLPKY